MTDPTPTPCEEVHPQFGRCIHDSGHHGCHIRFVDDGAELLLYQWRDFGDEHGLYEWRTALCRVCGARPDRKDHAFQHERMSAMGDWPVGVPALPTD